MEQLGKIFRKPLKTYCGGKTNAEIVILHYVEQKTLEMLRGRNVTYFLEKLIKEMHSRESSNNFETVW